MNRFIFLPPLLLMLNACSESPHNPLSETGHGETGQPALHAVHNKQLHELMNRMNSLMQERFMTEPEMDAERSKYAQRISRTAQSMSQTLDAILATSTSLKLSKTEEDTFKALAQKLHRQAQELQSQAEQNRMTAIPNTLAQISTTCTSCHTLFRKL